MKGVDLFAGWGGFTLGAEEAGVSVVWAANHWPLAVRAHAANHPGAQHECQDLRQADWTRLPSYDLLLASPACQGHSTASQPRRRKYHDELRATAWAVIDCADMTEPRAVIVENVVSFRRWRLYPLWIDALRYLGYHVDEHVLMASRLGVPQRRKRLFVVATRRPIRVGLPLTAEAPFGACVDWSAPGWRPVERAKPGARERIERGRARCGATFLTQHVTGHPGVPLGQPIRTITTKEQWAIVDGDRYRRLTARELARGMGFPDSYGWPPEARRADILRGLGNAVCPPVARQLIAQVAAAM